MESDSSSTISPAGLLALLAFRGIGPQAAQRLAEAFPTLGALREAPAAERCRFVSSTISETFADDRAWSHAWRSAVATVDQAERLGVRLVTFVDRDYPLLLRYVADRPPVLFVRGQLRAGPRHVACIGTREPSLFGEEVTRRIVGTLVERQFSIVSGLALGVDATAHRAALQANGHTVAVLANGLDSVYPKKNANLAEDILAAGGAIVGEQPFDIPANPRNLVQRDRIQSGFSLATIPMQTTMTGGSMHTVRYTLLQKRLLFAPVPTGQHATEPQSRGVLALSQQTGTDLAKSLHAEGEYRALLTTAFAAIPPAIPLRSRHDYEDLVSRLNDACQRYEAAAPRGPAQASLF